MTSLRYGVFLRPDPATCWAVTQIVQAVREQFNLVAAAAFPPHATIVGNFRPRVGEAELVARLDEAFARIAPVTVYNHCIRDFAFNINDDESGSAPNAQLAAVNEVVREVVVPLHLHHDDFLAPNVDVYTFRAHLTLAGFDLSLDPRLKPEVDEFIRGLPIEPPASFQLNWYTLYELASDDWEGRWWEDQRWRHVKSWDVR